MKFCRRTLAIVLAGALLASLSVLGGCAGTTGSKQQALTPTINPPAVQTSGVLKVGVDSTHAPYAGTSKGQVVGIDVDIAAAMAEQLGLKVEIVDIVGKTPDELLSNGTVDVIMDVEQSGSNVTQGKTVGPYLLSGPGLFTKVRSNELSDLDIKTLTGTKITAQKDSLSAWTLDELIGKGTANPVTSLADALKAVNDGSSVYAAADAVVGSYLAVDSYADIACVKILGTPIGVYCAVSKDNATLADALTNSLRILRDQGKMVAILGKWLGPVSSQVVVSAQAVVSQNAAGGAATGAPNSPGVDAGNPTTNPADQQTPGTGDAGATPPPQDTGSTADAGQIDTGEDLPDAANAGGNG